MTPQLSYALRRVGVMIALAVLGVLAGEQTGLLETLGLDTALWGGIVAAGLTSLVRAVEGYRDGLRAEKGEVIKEDVKPLAPQPEMTFDYEYLR